MSTMWIGRPVRYRPVLGTPANAQILDVRDAAAPTVTLLVMDGELAGSVIAAVPYHPRDTGAWHWPADETQEQS